MFTDWRIALKSLSRYPMASLVAILSLALGIGCTAATLALRDAIFVNFPPLYQAPETLSFAGVSTLQRPFRQDVSPRLYDLWKADESVVAGIAASTSTIRDVRTAYGSESTVVRSVTANFFATLGVRPQYGSDFSASDAAPENTVILSFAVWERLFQSRDDTVGQTLWIDGSAYTIIGIAPRRFWYREMEPAIWIPLDAQRQASESLDVVVRRKPGVSEASLAASFGRALETYVQTLPERERNLRLRIDSIRGTPIGWAIGPGIVWLLEGCVFLTLLISCTNVAVLMIAQWTARERETAIRAALGATRGRIVRSLITESVLIAGIGGIVGIAVTAALRGYWLSHGSETHLFNTAISFRVLAASISVILAAGILTGLAPALYETRRLQRNPLRAIPSDRVRHRVRSALVVFEISVTVALLVVTSMMADGYRRALDWTFTFDPASMVLATVDSPAVNLPLLAQTLNDIPGVTSLAAASSVPLNGFPPVARAATDGAGSNAVVAGRIAVASGFFATLNVAMKRGRTFSPEEESTKAVHVSIINQSLADRLWPGQDPIGKQVFVDAEGYEVIGIVGDQSWSALRPPGPDVYLALAQRPVRPIRFVLKTAPGNAAAVVSSARTRLAAVDPSGRVSVTTAKAVEEVIAFEVLSTVLPMTPLIATGIFLTSAGIYSVLAFAVARRSRELAIRMAVGASRRNVVVMVAGLTARLVGLGLLCGGAMMYWLKRLAQGQGGPLDSDSTWIFLAPAAIVVVIGVLATMVPSRRAMAVDPAVLLRSE